MIRTPCTLIRITAPHFCAGALVDPDGRVAEAAPIIRWAVGRPVDEPVLVTTVKP